MIPLSTVLKNMRQGAADEDAGEKLNELIAAVKATGKKGSLTLKLSIEPDGTDDEGNVETVATFDEVKLKKPELPKRATIFFLTEDNDLSRNQQSIPGVEAPARSERAAG